LLLNNKSGLILFPRLFGAQFALYIPVLANAGIGKKRCFVLNDNDLCLRHKGNDRE